ncbi:hypothetical protein Fcan01_19793 [Folsomia candida]|uniref:Uncharacterized protein n=1 Tax=Folsomia candida TaxID=158441 RepID=A0A226DJJ0_FOLCA|nr:hypothetical protein Fcan01_19793 [Folsomia candida]
MELHQTNSERIWLKELVCDLQEHRTGSSGTPGSTYFWWHKSSIALHCEEAAASLPSSSSSSFLSTIRTLQMQANTNLHLAAAHLSYGDHHAIGPERDHQQQQHSTP